jgi:hypothetical protein
MKFNLMEIAAFSALTLVIYSMPASIFGILTGNEKITAVVGCVGTIALNILATLIMIRRYS